MNEIYFKDVYKVREIPLVRMSRNDKSSMFDAHKILTKILTGIKFAFCFLLLHHTKHTRTGCNHWSQQMDM